MIQFHVNGTVELASEWYANYVAQITKSTNATANGQQIRAQLQRYFATHKSIFGAYKGRLPPKPANLLLLNCTFLEFVEQRKFGILLPLFTQFYTMQGMGLLTMPAYYVLKWCNPTSMQVSVQSNIWRHG